MSTETILSHKLITMVMELNALKFKPSDYRLEVTEKIKIYKERGWRPPRFNAEVPEWMYPLTPEDAAKITRDNGVATTEAIVNDDIGNDNKVLAFTIMAGDEKSMYEILEDINADPCVTSIGKRAMRRAVARLEEKGQVEKKRTDVNGQPKMCVRATVEKQRRSVTDCLKYVDGTQFFVHRCLKVTKEGVDEITGEGTFFEIFGKYKADNLLNPSPLVLVPGHELDPLARFGAHIGTVESSMHSRATTHIGETDKHDVEIELWHVRFFTKNPNYKLFSNNCRHHARELARFLTGVDIGNAVSMEYGNAMSLLPHWQQDEASELLEEALREQAEADAN